MSYIGSDNEQDPATTSASAAAKSNQMSEFRRQRSNSNMKSSTTEKSNAHWLQDKNDDTDSEVSENHFLAKGAFLLTPSSELTIEKAAVICEKMNFKGCFSLTKTATGILFKFSHPEDYQNIFKKGFHKVTGARFYKKVAIPCRPQKTFTLFVHDIPEELPEEDIRFALYKFNSVVEVVRLVVFYQKQPTLQDSSSSGHQASISSQQVGGSGGSGMGAPSKVPKQKIVDQDQDGGSFCDSPPSPIRITLASVEEYNYLLQNGLDFYGATYFPTEANLPATACKIATRKGARGIDGFIPGRVRELLPVFDASGFAKMPMPASKTFKPRP